MINSSFPPGGLPLEGHPERLGGSNIGIHNRNPVGFRGVPRGLGLMIGRTTIGAGPASLGGQVASQVNSLFGTKSL